MGGRGSGSGFKAGAPVGTAAAAATAEEADLTPAQIKEYAGPYQAGYGYGYGVRTLIDPGAGVNTSLGEFGWTGMLGTYVVMDPTEKASIVYMHNLFPNMEEYIHTRVRNVVFGALK